MSKMIKRLMVVLLSALMFVGVVTTPVQAKGPSRGGRGRSSKPVYAAQTLNDESENYNVTVSFGEDAKIESGAYMNVTELEEGTEAYESAKNAILAEKGLTEGELGFALFDITLYKSNGEAVEPQSSVNVSVEMKLPAEAASDTLELQHLDESAGTTVVETVADSEQIAVIDEENVSAEFAVDSFSTFALTWKVDGTTYTANIHWGELKDGEFTEFDAATLDATASSVNLANTYSGYSVYGAAYQAPNSEAVDLANYIVTKIDSGWTVTTKNSEDDSTATVAVADGSDIYVYYAEPVQHQSGANDKDVASPVTEKSVERNDDGTYTITLDITGTQVTETQQTGANVLLVLDTTYSMASSMTGADNRFEAARSAALTLIDTLNPSVNDIEFALVEFDSVGTIKYNWTKDHTTFRNYMANTAQHATGPTGTNWESGLYYARQVLNSKDSDNTYVIFLTDGEPNRRGTTTSTNAGTSTAISYALTQAQAITGTANTYLYGVFCGSSTGYNNLNNMINNAGGVKTINGTDSTTLQNEFKSIAQTIVDNLGASGVSVDDGVTELSSVSAAVSGEASGYKYYKKGKDETEFTEWAGAPGASYSADNGVTWDLSAAGVLPSGTTYRLQFTVWPSQDALDLVADLNNGLKDYSTLDPEVKSQITDNGDGTYSLLTNTHLNTTYTFKDKTYTDEGDKGTNAMALDVEKFTVLKKWENDLDQRTTDEVTLIVTKDGENYLADDAAVVVTEAKKWVSEEIFISCGYITKDSNGYTIRESGHDYSVIEPEDYAYYWDLTADVYRPMVINGTPTMLILDDAVTGTDGTDYYTIAGHKYKVSSGENQLTATNKRRSYLNVTKVVDSDAAPADAEFKYELTIGKTGDDDIWFSVQDSDGATIYDLTTDATAEINNENVKTGYYFVKAGTKFYLNLKNGWNCRVINLPLETEYTVEETEMPSGFEFKSVAPVATGDGTAATVTGAVANGTVDKSNTDYTLTYTNGYYGFFYVYHSSNNTIERISLQKNNNEYVDSRITSDGKFNIVNEVNTGSLYGGYYQSYTGAKMTDAQILAATYDENKTPSAGVYSDEKTTGYWANDIDGKVAYTGAVANAWKGKQAYTVAGTAMTPSVNTVYYLKEVPEAYFTPGIYYVYDDRADDKPLKKLYLLVPTDDGNYNGIASVNNIPASLTKKLYASYKITNEAMGTTDIKRAADVNDVPRGYLTVWDVRNLIPTGESYEWTPNFITKDGITVTGTIMRTIVIGNGCYDASTSKKYDAKQEDVKAFYVYDTAVKSKASAN